MKIPTDRWNRFAESVNASFYEVEPGVLAVVPVEGSTDDGATAKASIDLQLAHLRTTKRRAGVLVFMDGVARQTTEARTVYREAPDPTLHACFALVGGTAFGRAIGSIFLGLSKPPVPTRMFATMEDALAWARERAATS